MRPRFPDGGAIRYARGMDAQAPGRAPASPPVPVAPAERIGAIDAARGFALLGIFFVNIITFAEPFGRLLEFSPGDTSPPDRAAFYFVKTVCEGKFYPLFSTLFGAGMTIQMLRARRDPRPYWPRGLRRLAVLGALGLCHALFLWYGDILFIYAVMGLLLLATLRASPKVLAILGTVIVVFSVVISTGFTLLTAAHPPEAHASPTPAPAESPVPGGSDTPAAPTDEEARTRATLDSLTGPPFQRLLRSFEHEALFKDAERRAINPMTHPVWLDAETEAYRRGPYTEAMKFRAGSWAIVLLVTLLGFGWTIVGMFFIGAALVKWDAFAPHRLHWHTRFAAIGLGLGLPLSALSTAAPTIWGFSPLMIATFVPLQVISGPMVALGYLGAIRVLVARGVAPSLFGALAAAGRMALTVYLLETTFSTLVFYHYGLGWFGTLSRVQGMALVVAIYICLVVFSVEWLRHFRFGPMEWLWRSLTYLRPQPMRRRQHAAED